MEDCPVLEELVIMLVPWMRSWALVPLFTTPSFSLRKLVIGKLLGSETDWDWVAVCLESVCISTKLHQHQNHHQNYKNQMNQNLSNDEERQRDMESNLGNSSSGKCQQGLVTTGLQMLEDGNSFLKNLRHLDLSSTSLQDDALIVFLQRLGSNLTSLNVHGNLKLTANSLGSIPRYCPKLVELDLRGCFMEPVYPKSVESHLGPDGELFGNSNHWMPTYTQFLAIKDPKKSHNNQQQQQQQKGPPLKQLPPPLISICHHHLGRQLTSLHIGSPTFDNPDQLSTLSKHVNALHHFHLIQGSTRNPTAASTSSTSTATTATSTTNRITHTDEKDVAAILWANRKHLRTVKIHASELVIREGTRTGGMVEALRACSRLRVLELGNCMGMSRRALMALFECGGDSRGGGVSGDNGGGGVGDNGGDIHDEVFEIGKAEKGKQGDERIQDGGGDNGDDDDGGGGGGGGPCFRYGLRELGLENCRSVDHHVVKYLVERFPHLEKLDVSNCPNITEPFAFPDSVVDLDGNLHVFQRRKGRRGGEGRRLRIRLSSRWFEWY
jgi:hypothetical protein